MQEKKQTSAVTKWMTLIIVAIAGGLMTKLPYLRETYMVPLQEATGATKTQLGLIMSAYGIVNFICYLAFAGSPLIKLTTKISLYLNLIIFFKLSK